MHVLAATIVERLLLGAPIQRPARVRVRLGRRQIMVETALVLNVWLRLHCVVLVLGVHAARRLLGARVDTRRRYSAHANAATSIAMFDGVDLANILHRVDLR